MNNTTKKNELTKAHLILFAVSLLAVLLTFGSYVRGALQERQNEAAAATGGNRGAMGGPGGFNPQQMAARRLEQMTQQLQLTPEQVAKIKAIQDADAPRLKPIFDDTTLTRQQRREKMRPIRAASDAEIKALLTPAQQTKYDAMQAQRRAQFGGNGGNGGNNGTGRANGGFGGANRGNGANSPSVTAPPPPAPRN